MPSAPAPRPLHREDRDADDRGDVIDHGYVIALDAGGTHTRVGCFAPDGTLLGHATGAGGSPNHNDDARETVRSTLAAAIEDGGLSPTHSLALVAGIAGIEREGSNQDQGGDSDWAAGFVDLDGLDCPRLTMNDAVIAHRGALSGGPGVIVVAGTGSMILAIDAEGREVESGQFEHYAGAARHLVYEALQLLCLEEQVEDPLLTVALEHFEAADVRDLRSRLISRTTAQRQENKRLYGSFAPRVTGLAEESTVAGSALNELARRTARGVRLLAPLVDAERVPVACTGSMAVHPAFLSRLDAELRGACGPADLMPARLNPLGGAALLALETAGIQDVEGAASQLAAHPATSA